jgi:hypothetical protein
MNSPKTTHHTDWHYDPSASGIDVDHRRVREPIVDDYGDLVGYRELSEPSEWRT